MKKKTWIILAAAAVVVLAVVIWLLCLNSGLKQDKNDLTAQLADAAKTASQLQTDLDAAKADIDALTKSGEEAAAQNTALQSELDAAKATTEALQTDLNTAKAAVTDAKAAETAARNKLAQLDAALVGVERSIPDLLALAIGGTAVGTGLNAHPRFGELVAAKVAEESGRPFYSAANKFAALAAHDAIVAASASLRTLAGSLMKIANDVRGSVD